MFEQDYIMRQIKEITAVMAKVLFNAKVEDSFAMLQEAEDIHPCGNDKEW